MQTLAHGHRIVCTNTYQWDAENRLVQINYPGTGNNSQFTYDGLNHCVKILETSGGTTTSTRQFIWCNNKMCEVRNAGGTITAQYFSYGETIGGANYFYTKDGPPGSVREITDSSGNIQAQYAYDPYGQVSNLQGSLTSDFQFADYYFHSRSNLLVTWFRQYNPRQGRWLSRDPIGNVHSGNLYAYVRNNPINYRDPLGLYPRCPVLPPDFPPFCNDEGQGSDFCNCVNACYQEYHLYPGSMEVDCVFNCLNMVHGGPGAVYPPQPRAPWLGPIEPGPPLEMIQ